MATINDARCWLYGLGATAAEQRRLAPALGDPKAVEDADGALMDVLTMIRKLERSIGLRPES